MTMPLVLSVAKSTNISQPSLPFASVNNPTVGDAKDLSLIIKT